MLDRALAHRHTLGTLKVLLRIVIMFEWESEELPSRRMYPYICVCILFIDHNILCIYVCVYEIVIKYRFLNIFPSLF